MVVFRFFDHSMRRILSPTPIQDLTVEQILTERDFVTRNNVCEALHEKLLHGALVFFSDAAHFYLSRCVINKTCVTGVLTIPKQKDH